MSTERRARRPRALLVLGILATALAALIALPAIAAAAPANDDFANAEVLPAQLPGSLSGSLLEATKQPGEPDHAGDAGGESVWYSWTPTEDGSVGLRAPCFTGIEPLIGVYTGAAVNALTEVASSEDLEPPVCFGVSPEVEFEAEAGTTYRIAVDKPTGEDGVFFTLVFTQRPANDDFAAPTALDTAVPSSLNAGLKFATKQAGEPNHAGDPGGHSVWFSWTPAASGPIEISTCTGALFGGVDTLLGVYTGNDLGSLTRVAANDDTATPFEVSGCSTLSSEVRFEATAGTTYRIAVDAAPGDIGGFSLSVRGRAANDSFASAETVFETPFSRSVAGNTRLATKQAGEPNHAGNPGGHSLWYAWTPTSDGLVALSTCAQDPDLDPILAVYTGPGLGALTAVAANDDAPVRVCSAEDSEVQFESDAGTTYWIAVDGRDGGQGSFSLRLTSPPDNDSFARAENLAPTLPTGAFRNTPLATKEAGEPNHAGRPGGHSVWFTWTPAAGGPVEVSACSPGEEGPEILVGVYTGGAVNKLTPVASGAGASFCEEGGGVAGFQAVAGITYRIAVDFAGVGDKFFSLEVHGRPANDGFANPVAINPEPSLPSNGDTRLATKQAGEPNHAGDPGGHSVWFSWTPAVSGVVDAIACASGIDTVLGVYTGGAVDGLTPVASNDDAPARPRIGGCNPASSEAGFEAVAGTTYRIAVDTKGAAGRFRLAFERRPANDGFAAARAITGALPVADNGTTKLATKEPGEPNHAGSPGGHSVWFSWTPKADGPVTIATCSFSAGSDALLGVYTGAGLGALTEVAANDDTEDVRCRGSDSAVDFVAQAGTTYRIAVDSKGAGIGSFSLSVEPSAANDDFLRPASLGGVLPALGAGSNRFAATQPGEPAHAGAAGGASVWFKWTAPVPGPVSVDTCGSRFDTLLGVYTGAGVDVLTAIAANDDGGGRCGNRSRLVFDATAGTTYRIAVDGKAGAEGRVELRVDGQPRADQFAKASRIGGLFSAATEGSTRLATKEAGEPNHGGQPGGASVWLSWTPGRSSHVLLSTCADDFQPLVGVYTGAAVNALTPVASADQGTGFCDVGDGLSFDAVAGANYRIAVDGPGGDSGHFFLQIEPIAGGGSAPPPPLPAEAPRPPQPPTAQPRPPKPLKCKRGFVKKKVRGKVRCVKKKTKKPRKHRR